MDLLLKIPNQRAFPRYESSTFEARFNRELASCQDKLADKVVYFHGCYVNYNNHSLGLAMVRVLNAMGIGVELVKERCCGVPLIANGYLDKARENGRHNIGVLSEGSEDPTRRIVSTSSSCTYALKNEYPNLLKLDNSKIHDRVDYVTKFVQGRLEEGRGPELKPVPMRVAYHAPCHLGRLGGIIYTIDILKRIPALDLVILHSECCGISGTYGFKKEYYEISQDVGSRLFKSIEEADPEFVVTDCETCRMQIEMNTRYKVLHPVDILDMSLNGRPVPQIPAL
jgi:glycerol-3-phosphate dehydrogenase subunit C